VPGCLASCQMKPQASLGSVLAPFQLNQLGSILIADALQIAAREVENDEVAASRFVPRALPSSVCRCQPEERQGALHCGSSRFHGCASEPAVGFSAFRRRRVVTQKPAPSTNAGTTKMVE